MAQSASMPRTKKRLRPFLFQYLIIAGFLTLVWFSFQQYVLAPRSQSSIPENLGGLELIGSTTGSEALAQVSKLHGIDITLASAYIAKYANNATRVTVWVGKAQSNEAAAELLTRMTEGIAKDNSGFSNLQRLSIKLSAYSEHNVFQVDGPGGKHFFYRSHEPQNKVIWLTIEAADAIPILNNALRIF